MTSVWGEKWLSEARLHYLQCKTRSFHPGSTKAFSLCSVPVRWEKRVLIMRCIGPFGNKKVLIMCCIGPLGIKGFNYALYQSVGNKKVLIMLCTGKLGIKRF